MVLVLRKGSVMVIFVLVLFITISRQHRDPPQNVAISAWTFVAPRALKMKNQEPSCRVMKKIYIWYESNIKKFHHRPNLHFPLHKRKDKSRRRKYQADAVDSCGFLQLAATPCPIQQHLNSLHLFGSKEN